MVIEILTGCYHSLDLPDDDRFTRIELDIGCGKGGFLIALAQRYPSRLIIGVDVMLGRLRKIKKKVIRNSLSNVRLIRADAWSFVGYHVPDRVFDRIHILCPDPWPKNRHRRKRLLNSEFLGKLQSKFVSGGVLHLATDHQEYYAFIQRAITPLPGYDPAPGTNHDVRDLKTDFEADFAEKNTYVTHSSYRVNNNVKG